MQTKTNKIYIEQYNPECIFNKVNCDMQITWTDFPNYYTMVNHCPLCGHTSTMQFKKGVNNA